MSTLKEKLKELTLTQHQLAIWESMFAFLEDNFISKDGRDAKLLRVPDSLQEIVPEEVIEDILEEMNNGPIQKLRARIEKIEATEIPGEEDNAKN